MKIEITPKDIRYKIQVGKGEFENMLGSLVIIKGHEIGVGPQKMKDGFIYVTLTDLRTGVALFKFKISAVDFALGSTRELAMGMYENKMNLLSEEHYDYIFKKADETLGNYVAAPAYEVLEVSK